MKGALYIITPYLHKYASTSRGLIITASILMIIITILLTYVYIIKRKKELAVLRVLGVKKTTIFRGIIVSLLATVLIGSLLGGVLGIITYKEVMNRSYNYELGKLSASESEGMMQIPLERIIDNNRVITYATIVTVITMIIVFVIATVILINTIRKEPVRLLSK